MKNIDGRNYYSLYEYLGHPAGADLGAEVNEVAVKQKQKFVQQHVETNVYTGEVFCYTKEFLDEYFESQKLIDAFKIMDPVEEEEDNDDLPF